MFGFLIGTICLIALVSVARGRGRWGRHRRGRPSLHYVFERLDTAPGQEKAIQDAVEEFRQAMGEMRGELKVSRAELAAAVKSPVFEPAALRDLFARHDGLIDGARKAATSAFGKVHDVLNERQRKTLGDLIEAGHHFYGRWGSWRSC